jgi:hypothetical protein
MNLITRPFLRTLLFDRRTLIAAAAPFVLGFILFYVTTSEKNSFSICLLINVAHVPCPSCGLSRSFAYLTHGRFMDAFSYNWLIIPAAALFASIIVLQLAPLNQRKRVYRILLRRFTTVSWFFKILGILYILYGIVRVVDIYVDFIGMRDVVPDITLLKLFFKSIRG